MLFRDLIIAARGLRQSPVFAVTAVLTIALGIGASTAIFSVANAVLLRPLPYRDPGRLVFACVDLKQRNVRDFPMSNADFFDLRSGATSTFEDFAAATSGRAILPREDGTQEEIRYASVTPNLFRLLGAKIAFGRDFTDADGQPALKPPPQAIVLSHEFFERRYGGNTAVLGHALVKGKDAQVIVGVLAPGFELLFPPAANMERTPDLWIASRLPYDAANRLSVSLSVIGRLKPGVTVGRAQAQADSIAAEARRQTPIWRSAGFQIRLEPMHRYLVAQIRPAIVALMGAVIFLLLIACANVANLLLVRASLRVRELAVRTALGASWWRIARHMLAEALLLSTLGSLAGAALARLGIRELLSIAPAGLPRLNAISIDPAALAFTAIAGLSAAAIFGMAPALRAARPDIALVLRASGRTAGLGGGRLLRNAAVVAQVALSFVLLVGSGLMYRSFVALERIDPGFDPRGLLSFQSLGAPYAPTPVERAAIMRQMQDRLRAIPGVLDVASAAPLPLSGGSFGPTRWGTAEALADATRFQAADFQTVLPGYFETVRARFVAGRTFTAQDNVPESDAIIVDEFLAAKAFPNQSAIGQRFLLKLLKPEPQWRRVIGVVAHQRETSLAEPGREQIFITDGFWGHRAATQWVIRTQGDPAKYGAAVRAAMTQFSRAMVIADLQPMQVYVDRAQAATRFSLLLIAVFAAIAVLLAAVGLYGVLATVVRQRTAEIGVRMALGAAPAAIFQLVVGQGLRLSTAGVLAGLAAAFGLTRVMNSMLIGVKPNDPVTFAAMALLFLLIAALASWLPAWRAAGLDPTTALRNE